MATVALERDEWGDWQAEATPHIDGGFAAEVDVVAPCGGCPRFVLAEELCECGDELGPFCPACHRDWHESDRFLGGVA